MWMSFATIQRPNATDYNDIRVSCWGIGWGQHAERYSALQVNDALNIRLYVRMKSRIALDQTTTTPSQPSFIQSHSKYSFK
jgi:hypothetical protein